MRRATRERDGDERADGAEQANATADGDDPDINIDIDIDIDAGVALPLLHGPRRG